MAGPFNRPVSIRQIPRFQVDRRLRRVPRGVDCFVELLAGRPWVRLGAPSQETLGRVRPLAPPVAGSSGA
jgi:hypothetical protein